MLGTGTFVEVKLKSGEHTITVLVDDGTAMGRTALITAVMDDVPVRPGGDGGTRCAGRPFRYHGGELGTEDLLRDPRSIT